MKEKFIHFIKVITYQEYREMKTEWEKLNKAYDLLHSRKDKLQSLLNNIRDERDKLNDETYEQYKVIAQLKQDLLNKDTTYEETIQKIRTELQDIIAGLRNDIEKKDKKLKEKDSARKEANKELKAAKKTIGEQEEKIKQLEERITFLKSHRRAPDLEEIKDYQEGHKKGRKKKSEVVAG